MNGLLHSLLNAEPLDLDRVAAAWGGLIPLFSHLKHTQAGERSLLPATQSLMDALRTEPPPEPPAAADPVMQPWWSPMPAAYLAALFRYGGTVQGGGPPRVEAGSIPHREREAAVAARELQRELGVPFTARAHAAALLAHLPRAGSLLRSGASAEAYRRLACSLDLRALCLLRRAEMEVWGVPEGSPLRAKLATFGGRLEDLGVYGLPPAPPLGPDEASALGYEHPRERHRALNAQRYFSLVAGMTERDWHVERLKQERAWPACRLHLLIGPAGSGKSAWARENLSQTALVSSDRMREELTGDPADQSQNYLVFQRCMDRVREELKRGAEVTFDATNFTQGLRRMPVQAGRWCGAEVVSYLFDCSLEEALRRNQLRSRCVPEDVVARQHRLLEPPALYEADRHCLVRADGGLELYWPAGIA
jgi:predicted kinase